ncbi:VOC family protein [Rossellomorea vietnamensis]|uniref:VOC family protein n=1 Tax=Rossellomorea vietnamensis TaxID=218284 RepID=A0A5D4K7E1_9BACI|nr:VOC family protein [Rossellomorea vietnamensis]TYR73162.1 VOC family protein [Rossellomorea vietnamensis]
MLNIIVTSIFVENQDKALNFYTKTLGFVKKHDVPTGEHRWITVVTPGQENGTELLLEPNEHPAAKDYQQKLFSDGIPVTMFGVEDIEEEYKRLVEKGVQFTMSPTEMGGITIAVFDDTCGNLIQIMQQ